MDFSEQEKKIFRMFCKNTVIRWIVFSAITYYSLSGDKTRFVEELK